ncbi:MAG: acyl carrier protein [Ruminococcaceae bacterium]|nr:acyl carrier protein [Oscillospiraceae bacterium]
MQIFERLKPILADIFDVDEDELTPKTDLFDDLGADEYDMIELSMIIEEEFEKTVKLPKKGQLNIAKLCMLIEK